MAVIAHQKHAASEWQHLSDEMHYSNAEAFCQNWLDEKLKEGKDD